MTFPINFRQAILECAPRLSIPDFLYHLFLHTAENPAQLPIPIDGGFVGIWRVKTFLTAAEYQQFMANVVSIERFAWLSMPRKGVHGTLLIDERDRFRRFGRSLTGLYYPVRVLAGARLGSTVPSLSSGVVHRRRANDGLWIDDTQLNGIKRLIKDQKFSSGTAAVSFLGGANLSVRMYLHDCDGVRFGDRCRLPRHAPNGSAFEPG